MLLAPKTLEAHKKSRGSPFLAYLHAKQKGLYQIPCSENLFRWWLFVKYSLSSKLRTDSNGKRF